MSGSEKRTEELLDRIVLEIKALALLHGSDEELRARLRQKIIDSQDDSIRRFTQALQSRPRQNSMHLFLIAFGEILFASLLVLAGTVALIPSLLGVNTPAGLTQFFAERAGAAIGSSPLAQYISFLEFVVGALLVLSALYTLRQAALNLKEAGLSVRSGEG